MSTTHQFCWKEYLNLLNHGPSAAPGSPGERSEMNFIRELIEGGFATGSLCRDGSGEVIGAAWEGPTVSGRFLADDMQAWFDARTARAWFVKAAWWFFGWCSGVAMSVVGRWITG